MSRAGKTSFGTRFPALLAACALLASATSCDRMPPPAPESRPSRVSPAPSTTAEPPPAPLEPRSPRKKKLDIPAARLLLRMFAVEPAALDRLGVEWRRLAVPGDRMEPIQQAAEGMIADAEGAKPGALRDLVRECGFSPRYAVVPARTITSLRLAIAKRECKGAELTGLGRSAPRALARAGHRVSLNLAEYLPRRGYVRIISSDEEPEIGVPLSPQAYQMEVQVSVAPDHRSVTLTARVPLFVPLGLAELWSPLSVQLPLKASLDREQGLLVRYASQKEFTEDLARRALRVKRPELLKGLEGAADYAIMLLLTWEAVTEVFEEE